MKLLIVDDEVIIREGLSTVIKWEENGFTLLPPAASAEEVLMRMPLERPDVILTDIRMTGKSGLELAREVKKSFPDTEIVILSGYEEFTYAQQAIREGISDYLLKTSRPGEIMAAAVRARQRIEEKRLALREGEEHQSAFRFKLLERMLSGEQTVTERELQEILHHYPELRVASEWESLELWLVTAAETLPALSEADHRVAETGSMLREALSCVLLDWKGGWLCILRSGQAGAARVIRMAMERAELALGMRLFAAAGLPAAHASELRESVRTAEQASAYRFLFSESGIAKYEDIRTRKGMRTVCLQKEEEELTAVLRSRDLDQLDRWISAVLEGIKRDPMATPGSMKAYLHSYLVAAFRWLERAAASVGQSAAGFPQLESLDLNRLDVQPDEALKMILSAAMSHYGRLSGGRNAAIEAAIAYIRDHLDQSLTLSQLAAAAHMNPNYFSELFKRETGKNYIDFVTEARIEWATRLLRETPAKISEVARRVGYEDLKHFNKLFKRYTGETPSSYREHEFR